jgi:hypothetical protein
MVRCPPGERRNKRTGICESCPPGTRRQGRRCISVNDVPATGVPLQTIQWPAKPKRCPPTYNRSKHIPYLCEKCPTATRRNNKTRLCDPINVSVTPIQRDGKCPKGTRRNRQTGNCERCPENTRRVGNKCLPISPRTEVLPVADPGPDFLNNIISNEIVRILPLADDYNSNRLTVREEDMFMNIHEETLVDRLEDYEQFYNWIIHWLRARTGSRVTRADHISIRGLIRQTGNPADFDVIEQELFIMLNNKWYFRNVDRHMLMTSDIFVLFGIIEEDLHTDHVALRMNVNG